MKLCLFDLLINDNFKDYEKSHIIIRSLFWSLGLVPDTKTDSLGLHMYYIIIIIYNAYLQLHQTQPLVFLP